MKGVGQGSANGLGQRNLCIRWRAADHTFTHEFPSSVNACQTTIGLLALVAVSIHAMRIALLLVAFVANPLWAQRNTAASPLDLPLERRLDLPRQVASASLRLTDFVSFIA